MRFGMLVRRVSRPRATQAGILTGMLVALTLFVPSAASAATLANGGFETGDLSGWQSQPSSGGWTTYSGTSSPGTAQPVPAPPQGMFAAIADTAAPATRILYQDIPLEPGMTHTLSLQVYYISHGALASPNTLDHTMTPNQQYRIDVMKPDAPLLSVSPSDVLLNVFRTQPGDPTSIPPTAVSADLSPFAGQTVRLRFAEVDSAGLNQTAADAVSIQSTPIQSTPIPPSNQFTLGKPFFNRHGTAILPASFPGAGTVAAEDAKAFPRLASASASTKPLFKTVTVSLTGAQVLSLKIKPTATGKKKLNRTHRLKARVRVTFTPTGGTANSKSLSVVLKKKLKH